MFSFNSENDESEKDPSEKGTRVIPYQLNQFSQKFPWRCLVIISIDTY